MTCLITAIVILKNTSNRRQVIVSNYINETTMSIKKKIADLLALLLLILAIVAMIIGALN
jgi:hypothetical protein